MDPFVLDASVAISWCFPGDPTEDTPYSRRVLASLTTRDAIVPPIWPFEIANTLFVAFNKRKRITGQQIKEYLERLLVLPIRVEPVDLWANLRLEGKARNWNVSAYDAAYLDLALRHRLQLATTDEALRKVAVAEGLELLP
ncbi:MAG TPA: type II toxin-antitoxin system VapC family toxin [Terriglobia bacterium]|nr:type II toxin-antitoxin system VapC family toxin [Terriglobia bacterium]